MITVIGLGPMGQAMVRALVRAGHPTTVWNRTPSRAGGLGAVIAPSVREALAANDLILLSLTDYRAMYDVLDGEDLHGKVIVNLSSDSTVQTREAVKWLADKGAELIVGGVMAPAPLVGTDESYVFYSGPKEIFERYEPVLKVVGRPEYLGADHVLAQLYYQAQLGIFLTSLSAYLHASVMLNAAGVSAQSFASLAADNFNSLSMYIGAAAKNIDEHDHPGDLADVTMMGATAAHIVETSHEFGVDAQLPEAVKAQYDRAIAAGYGKAGWTSLAEVLKT